MERDEEEEKEEVEEEDIEMKEKEEETPIPSPATTRAASPALPPPLPTPPQKTPTPPPPSPPPATQTREPTKPGKYKVRADVFTDPLEGMNQERAFWRDIVKARSVRWEVTALDMIRWEEDGPASLKAHRGQWEGRWEMGREVGNDEAGGHLDNKGVRAGHDRVLQPKGSADR